MEDKQKQAQGNSFLMGVVVGVIITLLFTTKRGREIFKDVVEKGIHKFSDLETVLQDIHNKDKGFVDPEDEAVHDDYVPTEPIKELPQAPEPARKHVPETKVKKEAVEVTEERVTDDPKASEAVSVQREGPEVKEKPATDQPVKHAPAEAEPVPEKSVEKEKEESETVSPPESQPEEIKPKTGKRWFRGLRRKK